MYIYEQSTGRFRHGDLVMAVGYSGFQEGKNNPLLQHVAGVGPIPQGAYLIGEPFDSPEHGPVTMHLVPLTGTELFGRGGFLIHPDSKTHPGEASRGCICLPHDPRVEVSVGRDRLLAVISGKVV